MAAEPARSPISVTDKPHQNADTIRSFWLIAAIVFGSAVLLTGLSHSGQNLAICTAAILIASGAAWYRLVRLIPELPDHRMIWTVLAVGLAMRLIFFASVPILEIDYLRYLWDGAAVHAGLNPYRVAPSEAVFGLAGADWSTLAAHSGGIGERINYGHLGTIYPAVAQAVFVLAHWLDPWGLTGLRTVFLLSEIAGIVLLMRVLDCAGRSRVWIAIYWWNPLIAKEFINSAHMDALLFPLLAGFLLVLAQHRHISAALIVGLAAGVKIWPLLLAPLALVAAPFRQRAFGALLICALLGAIALPVAIGRLDQGSGFVAYAGGWERNDALFGLIRIGIGWITDTMDLYAVDPGRLARLFAALIVGLTAIIVALRHPGGVEAFATAALIVAAVLLLISPTGYPWYYGWVIPFLCLVPVRGLMLLGVLMPIYYLRFAFADIDQVQVFDDWIVWIEFGPVLALLAYDGWLKLQHGA